MQKMFSAKTVDEAKKLAASEFAVDVQKITFEIVEEPKKSIFGRIKGQARVNAIYEPSKEELVVQYLENIILNMGIDDAKIECEVQEDNLKITVNTECEKIIGKRGEVVDSLQYLSSIVMNRNEKDFKHINLDINNYREKRKLQLEQLTEKVGARVLKTGRSSAMAPMNAYERRIVHAKVSVIDGIVSRSTGQDPYRKVIIYSNNPATQSSNKNTKHKSQNRKNNNTKKSFDIKTSFEKDYKKPRPEDNIGSGLYSKIEF